MRPLGRRKSETSADSATRVRHDVALEMARLTRQAEAAQRCVSSAAHEILSPLTVAKGELELALTLERNPAADRATFEIVLGELNAIIALTEDLLALARRESPDARPTPDETRLQLLVDQAVQVSLAAIPAVRVVDVQVDDVLVRCRAEEVVRLVRNLVDNALEHGPEGSRIRVAACPRRHAGHGKALLVSVEDDGPGIPPELHERIFEPFFQGQRRWSRHGAGLGLAIAREIARRHGGELAVDASSPRTRFVAVLPILADGGASGRRATTTRPPISAGARAVATRASRRGA